MGWTVCEVARRDKDARFTALLHHVTPGLLLRSFDGLKKDAAPGADGVTWRDYERGALPRLVALHERMQSGKSARVLGQAGNYALWRLGLWLSKKGNRRHGLPPVVASP
jgi:hypothetical protein